MPCRTKWTAIGVVDHLRVRVEVECITLVDELEIVERPRPARLHPLVVRLPHRPVGSVVLGAERLPFAAIVGRKPAVCRRDFRSLHLQRLAADDAHERHARCGQGREAVDVVLDDHVRSLTLDDLFQLRLAIHRPVDQGLPGRLHESAELIERRRAKHRLGLANEIRPELTGGLLWRVGRRWWREIDEVLDEAQRLQATGPRCLRREHHLVAAPEQDVADSDAVVRRPVGALRHEQEGGHGYRSSVTPGASMELAARLLGRPCSIERPITVDQTNRSVVVDESVVVKWLVPPVPAPHPGRGVDSPSCGRRFR